jgi:hypothetical protein
VAVTGAGHVGLGQVAGKVIRYGMADPEHELLAVMPDTWLLAILTGAETVIVNERRYTPEAVSYARRWRSILTAEVARRSRPKAREAPW